jgi:hypothetical protein
LLSSFVLISPHLFHVAGGRDVWYSDANSVIAAPTEKDVQEKVNEVQKMQWDRHDIREGALHLRAAFWDVLNKEVQQIFSLHGVNLDAAAYAKEHFVHKMGL